MVGAFAPLMEISPDRATPELMELTALLGSMMPYQHAASVLAEFLPVEPTESYATVRKRTIRISERLDDQIMRETYGRQGLKRMTGASLRCSFPVIAARNSSSASIRLMFAVPSATRRETSSLL